MTVLKQISQGKLPKISKVIYSKKYANKNERSPVSLARDKLFFLDSHERSTLRFPIYISFYFTP